MAAKKKSQVSSTHSRNGGSQDPRRDGSSFLDIERNHRTLSIGKEILWLVMTLKNNTN